MKQREPHELDPQLATAEGLEKRIRDRFLALDQLISRSFNPPGQPWEVQYVTYFPPDRYKIRVHYKRPKGHALMYMDFRSREFAAARIPEWPYPGKLTRPRDLKT